VHLKNNGVESSQIFANIIKKDDLKIFIEDIPYCFMNNFQNIKSNIFEKEEYKKLKTKIGICKSCIYDNSCDGFWDEYLKYYNPREKPR
jgi:hypothetical protein